MRNIIVSNLNYIALALALMLSGCYQSVNKFDIDRATKTWGGTEEVVEIKANIMEFRSERKTQTSIHGISGSFC